MSKINLLVMGGAVGLLCAGSPAALAQSAPPGGSKTNASQTKPSFVIPNGGNFKYKGKSSQGDILLMDVDWQAAGFDKSLDRTKITGRVNYKNSKTNTTGTLYLVEDKSYITKTGELFFVLKQDAKNDDKDAAKVYGPVDLAALKDASLAKSDPSQDKGNGSSGSGTGGAPSNMLGGGLLTNSDNSLNSLSVQDGQEEEDNSVSKDASSSSTMSQRCAFKNAKAYDDRFKASGSFKVGEDTFHWKQKNSTFSNHRGILVRDGRTCTLASGADHYKPTLDNQGKARAYFRGKIFISEDSFLSDNYRILIKAHNIIKAEDVRIRNYGLSSLPAGWRNKKKKVDITDGTLILGAVIKSIGVENVGYKKTPLGAQAFDSIQGLLDLDRMGEMVHGTVAVLGLKATNHKTRGRGLSVGHLPNAFENMHSGVADMLASAPAGPWDAEMTKLVKDKWFRNSSPSKQKEVAFSAMNHALKDGYKRWSYANALGAYVSKQPLLFFKQPDRKPNLFMRLEAHIMELLDEASRLRATTISPDAYKNSKIRFAKFIDKELSLKSEFNGEKLVNIVEQFAGFEKTDTALRQRAQVELKQHQDLVAPFNLFQDLYDIPSEILERVRQQLFEEWVFRMRNKP